MLTGTFEQLHAAGCIQTGADVHENVKHAERMHGELFVALYIATAKNPCDGCPAYKGGSCKAYRQYNTRAFHHVEVAPFVRPATRCKECGLKIRRTGHAYGQDHIRRKAARAGK